MMESRPAYFVEICESQLHDEDSCWSPRKPDLLPWLAVHVGPYPHPDHVTQVPTRQLCLVFAIKRHSAWRDGRDHRGLSMEIQRRCLRESSVGRARRRGVRLSNSQSSSSSTGAFGKCLPMVRCERMKKWLEGQSHWKQYRFEKSLALARKINTLHLSINRVIGGKKNQKKMYYSVLYTIEEDSYHNPN